MAKKTNEEKNIFKQTREKLGLSRSSACDIIKGMTEDRLEKIENGRTANVNPEDAFMLAEGYKEPFLCNYFCANMCRIGQQYVPQIEPKELPQIILETLASLNALNKKKDRLVEIASDGSITSTELDDFIRIQNGLEKISIAVETLQLWVEKMLAEGKIDANEYNNRKNNVD